MNIKQKGKNTERERILITRIYPYDVRMKEKKEKTSYPNTSFPTADERYICSSTQKQTPQNYKQKIQE